MAKKLKAIKIDVNNQTITEVNIYATLEEYYKEINCNLIEMVNIDGKNDLIVDEEGLFKDTPRFIIDGYPQPLSGNALVVGINTKNGNTVNTTLTLKAIKEMVTFI